MSSLERSRIPLRYMATGGNEEIIRDVPGRWSRCVYMRSKKVKDIPAEEVEKALQLGKTTPAEVEAIWRLTSMPTFEERFVVHPIEQRRRSISPSQCSIRCRATIRIRKGAVGVALAIVFEEQPVLQNRKKHKTAVEYLFNARSCLARLPARNGGIDIGCFIDARRGS